MTMVNKQRLINLMTVGLLLFGTAPTVAQPTTNSPGKTDKILTTRVLFKPPQDDKKSAPKQTVGAGSRHGGQCLQDVTSANSPKSPSIQSSLMPLVPTSNFGLTLAERPILSIYLPETSARQVVLSIREEGTTQFSQMFVSITGASGIVSLQPNDDLPLLEIGKTYEWALVLVCGDRPSPNDPTIASWVRRIALPQPTNQLTTLEQASWYAEQGIWYDALSSLIQARKAQPQNQELIIIWNDFLESGGLKEISTESLQF